MVSRQHELSDDFTVVAIFDSTLENLRQHADRHHSPFPILADPLRDSFVKYAVEHSLLGVIKGMFMRMHTLLYAMLVKGYWPLTIKGSITSMPADFLVDSNGVMHIAHYGQDKGDHLSFEAIKRFANTTEESIG